MVPPIIDQLVKIDTTFVYNGTIIRTSPTTWGKQMKENIRVVHFSLALMMDALSKTKLVIMIKIYVAETIVP